LYRLLKKGSVDVSVVNIPGNGLDKNMEVKKLKTVRDVFIAGKILTT